MQICSVLRCFRGRRDSRSFGRRWARSCGCCVWNIGSCRGTPGTTCNHPSPPRQTREPCAPASITGSCLPCAATISQVCVCVWDRGLTSPSTHYYKSFRRRVFPAVMWSETVGLRTIPVWDQKKNRSWSWSCRFGIVLWKTILSCSLS